MSHFEVVLAPDRLQAVLKFPAYSRITKPSAEEISDTSSLVQGLWKTILEDLGEKKIVSGIDEKAYQSASLQWLQDGQAREVVVARAVLPQNGQDAKVEILFHPPAHRPATVKEPTENTSSDKSSKIDLKDLHYVTNVTKGTPLLRFVPPTVGTPGQKVTGEILPSVPGKDKKIEISEGVRVVETEAGDRSYEAEDDFILEKISTGSVRLTRHLKIDRDVDAHTGNIHALGSLTIRGSVVSGFFVHTTGDVTIEGVLEESSSVQAGGSVKIKGGVLGGPVGIFVKAGRDIEALFVQNAKLSAAGSIRILDAVVNSELESGGMVSVTGKTGCILTSRVVAAQSIVADVVGSAAEGHVTLVAGLNPALWNGLSRRRRELAFLKSRGLKGSYPRRFSASASKLAKAVVTCEAKRRRSGLVMERLIERREKLMVSDLAAKQELPVVRVRRKVHPKTRIDIGAYTLSVAEERGVSVFEPDIERSKILSKVK